MGTRLVGEISAHKSANGTDLFAKLAFLEHAQLSQPSIVAFGMIDLVAIQAEHRVGGVFQVTRLAQVGELRSLVDARGTVAIELHQRQDGDAELTRNILQPTRRGADI